MQRCQRWLSTQGELGAQLDQGSAALASSTAWMPSNLPLHPAPGGSLQHRRTKGCTCFSTQPSTHLHQAVLSVPTRHVVACQQAGPHSGAGILLQRRGDAFGERWARGALHAAAAPPLPTLPPCRRCLVPRLRACSVPTPTWRAGRRTLALHRWLRGSGAQSESWAGVCRGCAEGGPPQSMFDAMAAFDIPAITDHIPDRWLGGKRRGTGVAGLASAAGEAGETCGCWL